MEAHELKKQSIKTSRIKGVLLFGLLFSTVIGLAQTQDSNFDKYNLYKQRLENEFMIKSDPLAFPPYGSYIPAHKRNPHSGFRNSGEIHWSDAGHTLGYYLATVATEYAILKIHKAENNQLQKCLDDIVGALRAIERLDYMAEIRYGKRKAHLWQFKDTVIYPYPYPSGSLNGFFIRDDVTHTAKFTDSLAHYWTVKGQNLFRKTPIISSDYGKHDEMSQDQVWNLMQGLTLTAKLVKDTSKFIDGEGALVTPAQWSKKISLRLTSAMHTQFQIKISGLNIPIRLWSIVNPATKEIVRRGGKPEDLIFNARMFAQAVHQTTGVAQNKINFGWQPHIMLNLPLPGYKHFNDHAKLALATMGKTQYASSFDSLLYWCYRCAQDYNKGMPESYQLFTFVHFPLMYLILHEPTINTINRFYQYYLSYIQLRLNQAPETGQWRSVYDVNNDGKRNKHDHPEPFWSAGKRLVKPVGKDYVLNTNDPATRPWEYNGLDYMLLYNLFQIVRHEYFNNVDVQADSTPYHFTGWQQENGKRWKKVKKKDIIIGNSDDPFEFQTFNSPGINLIQKKKTTASYPKTQQKITTGNNFELKINRNKSTITVRKLTSKDTFTVTAFNINQQILFKADGTKELIIDYNDWPGQMPYLLRIKHDSTVLYQRIFIK